MCYPEIALLNELKKRKSYTYHGLLNPIIQNLDDFLQNIKATFPDYPDHGIKHSINILNYIKAILGDSVSELTDTEIFCFILSALFHDSGMALVGYDTKEKLRDEHHYNASIFIERYFNDNLTIMLPSCSRIKNVVEFVCEAHNLTLDMMYQDPRFSIEDTINNDCVRYYILAILLRIGDLMDLDNNRVNHYAIRMFPHIFSKESMDHNLRHAEVRLYNYNPQQIKIEVFADNTQQLKIWHIWFEYLKKDILRANTYLINRGVNFPMPETSISTTKDLTYSAEEIHFEIDDKGGIWDIISQSIYTNELDFLREVVQNAIDATLMTIYRDESISLENASPRSWNTSLLCDDVIVCFSEEHNHLFVIDHGIGMNSSDLRKFLFKVSGSGYAETNYRNFPFAGIAKYGIGFISCLICAEEIEIYTSKTNDDTMCKVSLDTKSNFAFIENLPAKISNGTVISLKLKHKFSYNKIEEYLNNTFLYPSVGISIINIDKLLDAYKISSNKILEYNVLEQFPHALVDYIEQATKNRNAYILPKMNVLNELLEIAAHIEQLLEWLHKSQEISTQISDKDKTKDFKRRLASIIDNLSAVEFDYSFDFSLDSITEKNLFTTNFDFYILQLETCAETIKHEAIKTRGAINNCPPFQSNINSVDISYGIENNYIVAFLDSNFNVSSIITCNTPIDLSDKQGILIINHFYKNYDLGLEYAAINGFLFHNGVICNCLSKITGDYCIFPHQREAKSFIVNSSGIHSIHSSVEEFFNDLLYDPEEDPMYLSMDDDSEFGINLKPTCDALYIDRNKFKINLDADIENIKNPQTTSYEWIPTQHVEFGIFDNANTDKLQIGLSQLEIVENFESIYCQDGIAIPDELFALFPVGYFKIVCNTTFNSRKKLNVSRHESSSIHSEIDNWLEQTGFAMQESLLAYVIDKIKKFNLSADFYTMDFTNSPNSYFSNRCFSNFRSLAKKYN